MNQSKALTLSLIIPAYNEERHLKECLDSVAGQTVMPDEVIVVDNNSTDNTSKIARRYPFVKIVREPVQGLIAARNHGFRIAKGNILGRIDCDAVLPPNWVELVKESFADASLAAVTGHARTCFIPYLPWPRVLVWSRIYHWDSANYFRVPILWGSNMAIRASAWKNISAQTSLIDYQVHEDLDISILLAAKRLKIFLNPLLIINTGGEQFGYLPKLIEYAHRRATTMMHHRHQGTLGQARRFAAVPRYRARFIRLLLLPAGLLFVFFAVFDTLIQWVFKRGY